MSLEWGREKKMAVYQGEFLLGDSVNSKLERCLLFKQIWQCIFFIFVNMVYLWPYNQVKKVSLSKASMCHYRGCCHSHIIKRFSWFISSKADIKYLYILESNLNFVSFKSIVNGKCAWNFFSNTEISKSVRVVSFS